MSNNHFTNKEIILGAAIGGLIVSAASALLMAPKTNGFKKNISSMCDDISDKTHEIADSMLKKGKCLLHMNCEEPDWTDKAKTLLSDMTQYLTCSNNKQFKCDFIGSSNIVTGVLAGAALGAIAGLFLAPTSGNELRSGFADSYEDFSDRTHEFADSVQKKGKKLAKTAKKKANKWFDLAQNIITEFVDNAEDVNDQVTDSIKGYADSGKAKFDQALEWASLGLKIWKGLNK